MQLTGKFLPGLIGFAVAALLTRLISPHDYGVYGLITAMAQLVALALFGWLGLSVMRHAVGHTQDPRFKASVLALFGAIALFVLACGAASSLLPIEPGYAGIVYAAAFGGIVFAFLDLKGSLYAADLDFASFLVLNIARAGLSAAAAIAVAWYGGDGLVVAVASFVATLVVCLLARGRRDRPVDFALDRDVVRSLCDFGLPLGGGLVLFAISGWIDRPVLEAYAGTAAVGLYTATVIIIQNTVQLASSAIGSAGFPLAVAAYESGVRGQLERQLEQNFIALAGFLLPAATGLCLLAPNIAEVLVGRDYREAVVALTPLLATAAVLSGIRGNFIDHSFQLTGATGHSVWIALGMAATNIGALLLLVPLYGYIGAGVASVVTAAVGLAHALIASRRVYRLPFPALEAMKVIVAVIAMGLALMPVLQLRGSPGLVVQVGIGTLTYVAAVFSLNILDLRRVAMSRLLDWFAAWRAMRL